MANAALARPCKPKADSIPLVLSEGIFDNSYIGFLKLADGIAV
jgi:hypothetical protein